MDRERTQHRVPPKSYLTGLLIAWSLFTGLFAAGALAVVLARQDPPGQALSVVLPLAGGLGLVNVLVLAAIAGPAILWLRARFGQGFAPWHASLVAACTFPLPVLLLWFVFREDGETLVGLLRFWWRVPGEFLLGAIPAAVAGAAFGAWVGASPAGDDQVGMR